MPIQSVPGRGQSRLFPSTARFSYVPGMKKNDTPLMQQWRNAKARDPGALLAFRVGDFFEFFYDDAKEAAPLLSLTLTTRNNGAAARVPLAGFPAKALPEYVGKLVRLGRRVAICEQVENPAQAKGIVKREVVETLTPGTVLTDDMLDSRRCNYTVSLVTASADDFGMAAVEVSTGELVAQLVSGQNLAAEMGRIEPSELVIPRELEEDPRILAADIGPTVPRTVREDWMFDEDVCEEELRRAYSVLSLDGFGVQSDDGPLVRAAGALVQYVREVRPAAGYCLRPMRIRRPGHAMVLDEMTRRNLELVDPLRPGDGNATVLSVLDDTVTPMGARLLRGWLLEPLVELTDIQARHEAVTALVADGRARDELRHSLADVADLERLAGRIGFGRATPRDLAALRGSLTALPAVHRIIGLLATDQKELSDTGFGAAALKSVVGEIDLVADALKLLGSALADDPPATLQEGGSIKPGWSRKLDEVREVRDGAQHFIASIEARERERTGIASLKVSFNRVFGYYIEVTRPNLARVPDEYVRRQTLTGAERFVTPELKEWEERVIDAEAKIGEIEAEAFRKLRERLSSFVPRIRDTAARVAATDVLSALAKVAERRGYVRPEMHGGYDIELKASRHPVVEATMASGEFIPNDLTLDEQGSVVVLTGPNMAGKSTVLRQVGLVQLLAQVGSFVPAASARLPLADRIFTRVGASDNLARGQSTFMVEMNETAAIVHGAGERSLVLLDEIGRGTSTYDGVSIAWAVTEHIHDHIGAKTVFATHYHELTQLADRLPRVKNMNVAVREVGDDIVFLRRLLQGGADRSYGVQVAKLAGVPESIIDRARILLGELEGMHGAGTGIGQHQREADSSPTAQLSFFNVQHPVVARLLALNADELSPRQALDLVYELAREARER